MIIDFHTHIFPDKIAAQTIKTLAAQAGTKAFCDGTLSSLLSSMDRSGVDYSVVLPVVTKPSQFESVNRFAASINNTNGIISFGGIHPDNDNISEKLEYIQSLGLKGIKLHPDYQGGYIDDSRYIRIIKECLRLDLCCLIHAGLDVGYPTPIHCPPDRIYRMLNEVLSESRTENQTSDSVSKAPKIILAHMGGYLQWRLVEELLAGQPVYFDLAFCNGKIETAQLLRIIKKHGSHRILYATDSPWADQKEMIDYVRKLPLTDGEIDNILYRNAAKLLDL